MVIVNPASNANDLHHARIAHEYSILFNQLSNSDLEEFLEVVRIIL